MSGTSCGCLTVIRTTWFGILVALLVGMSAGTTMADAADPAFERPRVGSCHGLGLVDIPRASDPSRPVSCGRFHTTRTIAVAMLPRSVDWSHDEWRVHIVAGGVCHRALARTLGATAQIRKRSAYRAAYFIPTTHQRRRGARWIRCDVMRVGGDRLLPLPRRVRLSGRPLSDALAACLTDRLALTACERPHVLRATVAYEVAKGAAGFPGHEVLRAELTRRCGGLAGNPWFGLHPLEAQWMMGDRLSVCFGPDPRA